MNFLKRIVAISLCILWVILIYLLIIFTIIECFLLIPAAILSILTGRDLKWLWIPDKKLTGPIIKIMDAIEYWDDYFEPTIW